MIWRRRDPYRWRKRFALRPRRIGERWVWLGRYAWRPFRPEENPRCEWHLLVPRMAFDSFEYFSLPCGYMTVRQQTYFLGAILCPPSTSWRPDLLKPRVVA